MFAVIFSLFHPKFWTAVVNELCQSYREAPDVGLAPIALWRVPPFIPTPLQLEALLSSHRPSLPTLPLPLPPTPLSLVAMLWEGAAGWCGGGVLGWRGVEGRAFQAALSKGC